jgi:hypothetical protein
VVTVDHALSAEDPDQNRIGGEGGGTVLDGRTIHLEEGVGQSPGYDRHPPAPIGAVAAIPARRLQLLIVVLFFVCVVVRVDCCIFFNFLGGGGRSEDLDVEEKEGGLLFVEEKEGVFSTSRRRTVSSTSRRRTVVFSTSRRRVDDLLFVEEVDGLLNVEEVKISSLSRRWTVSPSSRR